MLLTYANAPVILENDNNDTPDKAQLVALPCEIAGRIDKTRDRDWYVFDAKKGDTYLIEVMSHRLGANTDMYFVLKNLAAILLNRAAFTTDTAIYAGFSTAFAFLFWMYLNASILLLGAEFGRALRAVRVEERVHRASRAVALGARASRQPGK